MAEILEYEKCGQSGMDFHIFYENPIDSATDFHIIFVMSLKNCLNCPQNMIITPRDGRIFTFHHFAP